MNFQLFKTLSIVLLFFNLAQAQQKEVQVTYDFYFKNFFPELREIHTVANRNVSLSIVTRTVMYKAVGAHSPEPKTYFTNYYKTKDSIIYEEYIDDEQYVIGEELNQFNWKITNNSKTILNYKCTEATTTYRGRDYVAYFTTEVQFRSAPWKFHGLPGVLLEVSSTDEQIKMRAKSLKVTALKQKIPFPFASKDISSWDDFSLDYIKSWEVFANQIQSQMSLMGGHSSAMGSAKIGSELRMEILVDNNRGAINTNDSRN